jgi:phospholipase/carboxylesterase
VPVTPGQLSGVPVFVAQGDQDRVIPAELLERTWQYLLVDSGASALGRRDPGGHGITSSTLAELGRWIDGLGTAPLAGG